MSWKLRLAKVRGLFGRRERDAELDEELRAHLEMEEQENLAAGMTPQQARYAALRKFGNVLRAEEDAREAWRWAWLETLAQDIRFGLRMLARNPGFTAVTVLTLALGVGANTVIFSVVNRVLLRRLPYKDPGRLVWITVFIPRQNNSLVFDSDYFAWTKRNQVFEGMAAYSSAGFTLMGVGDSERLEAARVTAGFFPVLGVAPMLGRTFLPEEDRPGGPQVCVLGHELWQRRFGSDPSMVGKSITLDDRPYTVLGVMPASFEFVENFRPALYVPFDLRETFGVAPGEMHMIVWVIARLKPGVTLQRAESNLALINRGLEAGYQGGYAKMMAGARAQIMTLHMRKVGNVRVALLVLLGAVGFVLLIACANVANLQLARAVRRQKEIAIRTSLGAGRWRLARQLLTESLLLAGLGGTAGVGLASWGISVLRTAGPANIPHLADVYVDGRVLLFTALVSIVTGVLFGLVPVLAASKSHPSESLKEGGLPLAFGLGRQRARSALLVFQLALALVLLTGAGLLIRSFVRLTGTDLGFNPHHLLTARVGLPLERYQKPFQQRVFFEELLARLRTLPGVTSAEAVVSLPLMGIMEAAGFEIEGRPARSDINQGAAINIVSPGYFHALGIPLISGRTFTAQDSADAPRAVMVNQAWVRTFFSDESPVGKRIQIADMDWATVVGVVGDLRQGGLASRPEPEIFVPYLQVPYSGMAVVLRTPQDPLVLVPALRSQVQGVDRTVPVFDVATMDQLLSGEVASRRFNMTLLGLFALLAVVLAAVGIYGVMTYTAVQRTHEFGIRMVLGAGRDDVLGLVLRQGVVLVAIGIGIGLSGALALTRYLSSLLYGVAPTDAATFAAVSVLLAGVALVACYIPARRATKVDPMVALRYE